MILLFKVDMLLVVH